MKKLLYVSFALLLLMGLFGISGAIMDGKGRGMDSPCMQKNMKMGMGMKMSDNMPMMGKMMSLELNDKQQEDMRSIHMKLKKEVIKKKADIKVSEIELREILMKDPVDIKAAESKIKHIESIRSDIKILHIKAKEETKKNLTPEQRKKFDSRMQMHQMGMGMMGSCGCMDQMGMGMGMIGSCGCMDQMDDEDDEDPASTNPMQYHQ